MRNSVPSRLRMSATTAAAFTCPPASRRPGSRLEGGDHLDRPRRRNHSAYGPSSGSRPLTGAGPLARLSLVRGAGATQKETGAALNRPRLGTWPAGLPPVAAPLTRGPAGAGAIGLGLGDVHIQSPTVELAPVEVGDRLLSLFSRRHFDEAETARPASELVGHDVGREHGAGLREELAEPVPRGGKRNAAHEQFLRHSGVSCDFRR